MLEVLDWLSNEVSNLWEQAQTIWKQGGWAMIAIAVVAMGVFTVGFHVLLRLRSRGFYGTPEYVWRRWIHHPLERRGKIGRLLDLVTSAEDHDHMTMVFDELRTTETVPFERDLRVMRICVSAAPLVGLLGTVTGMLSTFGALASGSGGDQTMAMVASGISEALITTETGLVVALPGLFFQYQLTRGYQQYRAFLAHLESVCSQTLQNRLQQEERVQAKRAAHQYISRRLAAKVRLSTPAALPTT